MGNMRTSTQLLSGLGFLALLAPASAQSSSSIESSIESSFESSSTILPSSQSSSEIVSTTELSSTTGASSSSEVSSTQTSSEVSSFTTPSSSLSTSFDPFKKVDDAGEKKTKEEWKKEALKFKGRKLTKEEKVERVKAKIAELKE